MTVKEIADRLTALCRDGEYEKAQKELFSTDAESIEPAGSPGLHTVQGLDNIIQKGHEFQKGVEAVHSSTVSEPIVAGDNFAVAAILDLTLKGVGRVNMEELAVYETKGGKIIREQFFYRT